MGLVFAPPRGALTSCASAATTPCCSRRRPGPVAVPLKFHREGITYADLAEKEKEQRDALEWDEDGVTPGRVEAEAVNKWLFNKDTRA